MNLLERLDEQRPKRVLALDGSIWCSAVSLGFIKRLEEVLRGRCQKPGLVLADYFDLIGGTGTGAFFAAELALGKSAQEVEDDFRKHLADFYHKNWYWPLSAVLSPSVMTFSRERLVRGLRSVFMDLTLGSRSLETGLCVITKRVDTGATVPFINHPRSHEFERHGGIPLRDCVQASVSLPPYHKLKRLDLGRGEVGVFTDGALGMAAVPALYLLLLATLEGFPFRWPKGNSNLLITSIGTGVSESKETAESALRIPYLWWLLRVINLLWRDARSLDQLFLQYLSKSPTLWKIDDTVGDMAGEQLTPESALSYLRYDLWLEENEMNAIGRPEIVPTIERVRSGDRQLWGHEVADNLDDLLKISEAAARERIKPEHFPPEFDPEARALAPAAAVHADAPRPVKPIAKAFVSYHFASPDEELANLIRGLISSHGIPQTLDGKNLGGEKLSKGVLSKIKEADCLVALLTRNEELKKEGEWTTFEWLKDELNWARDQNMRTVALVEKGVTIKGAYAEYQRIEFTRENFSAALVELSHTLSIWKQQGAS